MRLHVRYLRVLNANPHLLRLFVSSPILTRLVFKEFDFLALLNWTVWTVLRVKSQAKIKVDTIAYSKLQVIKPSHTDGPIFRILTIE